MTLILGIDPGDTKSGWALIDSATRKPTDAGIATNDTILDVVFSIPKRTHLAIEMVASYGMPVGVEVFTTCVWVGRFQQYAIDRGETAISLIYRRDVKLHHCGTSKAKDSNVIQALVDRFAPGAPNKGKGTKAEPGWFHGFTGDTWQAYALAVVVADRMDGRQGVA